MSEPNQRMRRVNSIVRAILAREVEMLDDARLNLVSITGVDTAPNLRTATVYLSALDMSGIDEVVDTLNSNTHRFQAVLGREVRMKYTPVLTFEADPAVISAERIERLLRDLGEEE
ncbi:MAG: 30S ribosome-binding factor RbfA [Acidimicrobiia bacterium]|nr:30S ribosome-binding factor RbfA [Acidimicrobiia bacterium]